MSIPQILILREAAGVDLILGLLYTAVGGLGLLCIWHFSHTRRQLEKQKQQQVRREWRKLNLRGQN